jgi:UTP:GlnB (protein PII) uridylyltransferase
VTRLLADAQLDISAARLSTVGDTAIDTFYLTTEGQPLSSESESVIREKLLTLLTAE